MVKRSARDPNAPIPFKTAYLHFAADRRAMIVRMNPTLDCQEVSRELGRAWKSLTPTERRPWLDVAGHDRARFEAQMKNYNNPMIREAAIAAMPIFDDQFLDPNINMVDFMSGEDPNTPKAAKTAYIHFWTDKREELLRMHPNTRSDGLAKEISRVWREMNVDERQPWVDLAQHDKRRYDEEMEIFRHPLLHHPMDITNNTLSSSITSKTKKRKDPNAPKGPRTGFHFFLTQKREEIERENPGIAYNVLSMEVGKYWRALSELERSPWDDLAKQDKTRFEGDMLAYTPPRYMDKSDNTGAALQMREAMRKDPNAPKLPKAAYIFFSTAKRMDIQSTYSDIPYAEVMKQVGVLWKNLSAEDRKPWNDLAEEDKMRYENVMKSYTLPRFISGGKGKRRDPHAPRPPKSAFIHFQFAKRDAIPGTQSKAEYNRYAAEIGRMWKTMHNDDKRAWKDIAMEDRLRYDAEMENYKPPYISDDNSEYDSTGYKRKKGKARDPEAPKVVRTAYQYLFDAKRDEVMAENPGIAHNDAASIIGKLWREMTLDEKNPWLSLSAEDRSRYESEMATLTLNRYEEKKKLAARKDPEAPKAAKSAFMYVVEAKKEEILEDNPNMGYNTLAQEVAKIWHSMTEVEKVPWQDLADEDKARYDAEMANYDPILDHSDLETSSSGYATNKRRKKTTSSSSSLSCLRNVKHSPKIAKSAFIFFSSEKRMQLCCDFPDLDFADQMKQIGRMWNNLTDDERQDYVEQARTDKIRYDKEMQDYSGQNAYV